MKKFCIVIPIYKRELDCIEEISINSLKREVGNKKYDIYFVCPESLDISEHLKYLPKAKEKRFDDKFFKSTATYSRLCVSYDFYNSFSDYEYMIIYQLDCYIFRDEFKKWCDKGYDYIGGTIISTECGWDTVKKGRGNNEYKPYVGNGGFSLRKIETFKDICDPDGELRTAYNITDTDLDQIRWEDKFFCNDLYDFYKLYIPDWKEALDFSMDMSIDVIYNHMHWKKIPMAIHAWDKNIRWWKNVIPELINNKEIIDFCEEKHKEFFELYYDENDSTMRSR